MPKTDAVVGERVFVDDLHPAGMLHGALVRVDVPRGWIRGIDTSAAERVHGVVRTFTAQDFARDGKIPRFGPIVRDQPVLATDQIRYQGEPVCLVVAESEPMARMAAELVRVTVEELPPIIDITGALSGDLLHDPENRPPEQTAWRDSNVMGEWRFEWGSVESGERASDRIVEHKYSAPFAHHFAIETYGVISSPDGDGVTVWSSTQHPFILRTLLSETLGIDEAAVRVRALPMGGSFGSKGYAKVEPVTALASILLGRAVKVALTAEETFATAQREASDISLRTGFTNDGHIVFQDMKADFLIGAYSDISPRVVCKSGLHALAPYRTPNARVLARGLFTNTPPTTAFRGFGAPHTVMALEGQMNAVASALDIDPLDIRLANLRQQGDPSAYRETPVDGDWRGLLRLVADKIGWRGPKEASIGRGIAFGVKTCIPATRSEARVRLSGNSAVVEVGTTEMGQGTTSVLATLAANELGLPEDQVRVVAGDSARVPFDALTASSRSTVHMGNAVIQACRQLELQRGKVGGANNAATEVTGEGAFEAKADSGNPLGGPTPFYEAVATAVELSVDRETGLVKIERIVHATDAGTVLNPSRARGLDEGGILMGLGLTLSEQLLRSPDGRLRNGSSLDYRIPTIEDRPVRIDSLFQENRDGPGPGGAKGLAEGGILAVAPAVCAAIEDCMGVYIRDLPATPEKIWARARGLG
jgi:CO/xanthine dehydrogenase Mo-binding subunit